MKTNFRISLVLVFIMSYSLTVAQSSNASLLGTFNTDGLALDISVSNNRAYVADNLSGLRIIDVITPSAPTELGYYLPPTQSLALSVAINNNYAYVVTDNTGLRIVNISSPSINMVETGGIPFSGWCNGVAVSGNYAYVTNNVNGLKIINISDPANPTLAKTVAMANYANSVVVSGNYAYVTTDDQGLKVVDISNPSTASIVGSYPLPGHSYGISIKGNYVYIANEDQGLKIIDISTPTNPQLAGTFDTFGLAKDVIVNDNFAYVADYDFGLKIVDVANPSHPVEAGYYNTDGLSYGIACASSKVYVADYDYGLKIINNDLASLGSVTVLSPNNGEFWKTGASQNITWTSSNLTSVNIEYTTNNGSSWSGIANNISAASGSFSWTIPNTPSSQCKVRISSSNNPLINDVSDGSFKIYSLSLSFPNGGEKLRAGSLQNITWTSGGISNIKIEWTSDGTTWNTIVASMAAGIKTYSWSVPNVASTLCRVRLSDASNANINTVSANTFSIVNFDITSPNGGENWSVSSSHNITWNSAGVSNINIEYTTDSGTNWITIASNYNAASGSYTWTIPNTVSNLCKVKISESGNSSFYDESDGLFQISPPQQSVEVTAPNGAETWQIGSLQNITWTSQNILNVKLEYSTNGGTSWTTIISSNAASGGTYSWQIPNTQSTQCKVRVSEAVTGTPNDESNSIFSILSQVQKSITISSPNGGETWAIGTSQQITWTSTGVSNVKIEYSTNSGNTWISVVSSTTASSGSYSWTIPNTPSTQCKLKISDASDAGIFDLSNAVFTLGTPGQTLTLTSPNGGESWAIGSNHNITWQSSNISSLIIDYTTNNGVDWIEIEDNAAAATGLFSWLVPNTPSSNCKIRVRDASDETPSDQSNAVFTIPSSGKTLSLTSPAGGEDWEVGSVHNITWTSTGVDNINIQYSTNGGISWELWIVSVPASNGSYAWTIPNTQSSNCVVRISDVANFSIQAVSDLFEIFATSRNTTFMGGFNTPGSARNVVVSGKYAYVAEEQNGLRIIDISDPTNPIEVGYYDTPGTAHAVAVKNQYAYIADDVSGIRILDVSDPSLPVSVGVYDTQGEAYDLEVKSNQDILYIADGSQGLKILNVADAGNPVSLGGVNTPGSAYELTVIGGYALIADSLGGMRTISVSNPANPIATGSFTTGLNAVGISYFEGANPLHAAAVVSNHLTNQLKFINWDNPTFLTWETDFTTLQKPYGIYNDGLYLYAAEASAGMRIIQASDYWHNNTHESGHYDTDGESKGVFVKDNYIYVADGTNGLVIVRNDIYIDDVVTLASPNGNEHLRAGDTEMITFSKSAMVDKVKLEYSTDNGTTWDVITESTSNTNYQWAVPNTPSAQCRVRVSNVINNNTNDVSANVFTIFTANLAVTAPNGGENCTANDTTNITWTSSGVENIKIDYTLNNGTDWATITEFLNAQVGSFQWNVPNVQSANCKVRVKEINHTPALEDASNNVFTISQPILVLIQPNGGEWWFGGDTVQIKWFTDLRFINIDYSTDDGATWINIANSIKGSATSYTWIIPHTYSITARVRVSDAADGSPLAISANTFFIFQHPITITHPANGEDWIVSTSHWIMWNNMAGINNVKIEYSTDNGTTWMTVVESAPTTNGRYGWVVPNTPSPTCRLKISDVINVGDVGYSVFSISGVINHHTTFLGSYPNTNFAFDVFVRDDYAYVADALNGLMIFNVSDSTNPQQIGSLATPGQGRGITIVGNYAYLAAYDEGLRIIDISYPSTPLEVGFFNTPGYSMKVEVVGNYAYVSDLTGGFRILNVSNPASPFEVSSYAPTSWVVSAAISGNYAYLANYNGGIKILNINNPASPVELSSITNIGTSRDIEVLEDIAYLATSDSGLVLININDPLAPFVTNKFHLDYDTYILGLDIKFPYAYLAAYDYGVRIVDITDPDSLSEEAYYNTPGDAEDVFVSTNIVFVADASGLQIFRNDLPGAIPVELSSFNSIVEGNSVSIEWQTATETNNYGFYIERNSCNMDHANFSGWKEIGFVKGKGSSTDLNSYSFVDKHLQAGKYLYRLKQKDFNGQVNYSGQIEVTILNPAEFSMQQNYPNPFNPITKIEFELPVSCHVNLEVYSITGELITKLAEGERASGYYSLKLNSLKYNLSSGVYIYRLRAVENTTGKVFTSIKKMVLLK